MPFNKEVREAVLRRSGGLCERKLWTGQRCMASGAEFHHIVRKGLGGRHGIFKKLSDSEANCMLLCIGCHQERHDHSWNEDADELVPGREIRKLL